MTHLHIPFDRFELSPKQHRAWEFRAPPHPRSGALQIDVVGFFGDYGGGKSFSMMLRLLDVCLDNPFRHGVHSSENPPMTGLAAPTASDLKRGPLAEISKILGDLEQEIVVKKLEYGQDQHWELFNGHKILLYSAKGAKNGPTLCQFAADEFQERCWAGQWDNVKGRVRDQRAERLSLMASGIATRGGHVEDVFRLPRPDESGLPFCKRDDGTGNKLTVLLYPEDNEVNMAAGYVAGMQEGGRRGRDKDGWLIDPDVLFSSFSRDVHLRLPPHLAKKTRRDFLRHPVSVSVDPGRKAAVIWWVPIDVIIKEEGQRKRGRGLLIVDQWMPRDCDAEEIAVRLLRSSWNIDSPESVICLDPTQEPDQVRHFTSRFPAARIRIHRRGRWHKEENGVRALHRALRDYEGNQRLFIAPWVHDVKDEVAGYEPDRGRRGVVEALGGYLATKTKDKWLEHAADVVRYATQEACPLPLVGGGFDAAAEAELAKTRPATKGVRVSDLG